MTSTSCLGSHFTPKIWKVLLFPERNVILFCFFGLSTEYKQYLLENTFSFSNSVLSRCWWCKLSTVKSLKADIFKCQPFFRANEWRVLMKLWNSLQWPISIITSLIILNYPRRIRPINFWSTYSHHEVSSGLEYHQNGSYSNLIARQCLSYDNQEVIGLCHQKKIHTLTNTFMRKLSH